jgi:putative transposase
MLLGFKTELKLNNKQRTLLAKSCGTARFAYNWGLDQLKQTLDFNRSHRDAQVKIPSAIDLHKRFCAEVKPEKPWIYEVSKCSPQYALRHVTEALDRFFQQPDRGFPKFKKKGQRDSFTVDGSVVVSARWVQIPRVGRIKTYERLQLGKLKPKSLTISRQADSWFVSFKIEVLEAELREPIRSVGVDLGIKELATLSTGEIVPNLKPLRNALGQLKQLSRSVSRKVKGSRSREVAKRELARFHQRVAQARKDYLHKLTTWLAKSFDVICIEDLNVSGLLKNRKLARAIAELGLFEFRRQLEYKCKFYGSQLVVVSRWFPSSKTCSKCQHEQSMKLSERVYVCGNCGHIEDRDLNAAKNIEREGLRILKLAV